MLRLIETYVKSSPNIKKVMHTQLQLLIRTIHNVGVQPEVSAFSFYEVYSLIHLSQHSSY